MKVRFPFDYSEHLFRLPRLFRWWRLKLKIWLHRRVRLFSSFQFCFRRSSFVICRHILFVHHVLFWDWTLMTRIMETRAPSQYSLEQSIIIRNCQASSSTAFKKKQDTQIETGRWSQEITVGWLWLARGSAKGVFAVIAIMRCMLKNGFIVHFEPVRRHPASSLSPGNSVWGFATTSRCTRGVRY